MAVQSIRRALVSVTDKSGLVEFVSKLTQDFGIEIISTGGTARVLEDAGITVVPIEDYTGFPEMMGGRVKTLHPLVHGGLLAKRSNTSHMEDAAAHNIKMIDLVVVNLYEFEKTVARPDVNLSDAIENIDIGGPSMLRSAAKNHESVTVVSDPADYDRVLACMHGHAGATTLELRQELALKVFQKTAAYDAAIAAFFASRDDFAGEKNIAADTDALFPQELSLSAHKVEDLRYGENPQQKAAFYQVPGAPEHSLARAEQLQGKPLSYNNLLDTDAAWSAVREFDEPACIILKHQNPCGSAVAATVCEAYDRAFACDPVSAFGGIIACNQIVDLDLVQHMADENKQFVEVLIAPDYTEAALERLAKRQNLRVLKTGGVDVSRGLEVKSIDGGLLLQELDHVDEVETDFDVVTERQPTEAELKDLLFAWKVCKTVKSNAILVARDEAGLGMGPGQPNRVDAARIALERAHAALERQNLPVEGLVAASDAFFPFRDNVDVLAAGGVTAIIQPGGSMRDQESVDACNEHGIAMIFTGKRHFRH